MIPQLDMISYKILSTRDTKQTPKVTVYCLNNSALIDSINSSFREMAHKARKPFRPLSANLLLSALYTLFDNKQK